MWVYKRTEPGLYTVGFEDRHGEWHPDSDHGDRAAAAERVHYLNGGEGSELVDLWKETVMAAMRGEG